MSLSNVFDIAGSGMNAQSIRLNTTASNLANVDSASSSIDETYRARKPWFQVMQKEYLEVNEKNEFQTVEKIGVGVRVADIVEKDTPLKPRFQPGHPMANEDGYVYYPNVNVIEEMADMMSASRSYQMNVEVMKSAKEMLQRTLSLGQ